MGLDNYPYILPCTNNNTAVLNDDGGVNCELTQEAGGCPWLNANPPKEGRIIGIMGRDCWYRGKWGNMRLEEIGITSVDFYGDEDNYKSPYECLNLADVIGESVAQVNDPEARNDLLYAEWYLRWAAENTDGLNCWY